MKAQADLALTCRAEFQLDLQINREEHLCDMNAVRAEPKKPAHSSRQKLQEELEAARTEHAELLTFVDHLRPTLDALSEQVHAAECELLQLNVDEETHSKNQAAIRRDLRSPKEAREE